MPVLLRKGLSSALLQAKDPATGRVYIVAESRLAEIPGAVPKAKKGKKGGEEQKGFEVSSTSRPIGRS